MKTNHDVVVPPTLRPSDPDYARERFTTHQAAAYLCVGYPQIMREIAAGRLSYRRTGTRGTYRFSQHDLDQWRAAHRREAKESTSPRTPAPRVLDVLDLPGSRTFQ